MSDRVAGYMEVTLNGDKQRAAGAFSYGLGQPKRDAVIGPDRFHGFKELPQVAYIEGMIVVTDEVNLIQLANTNNASVTLTLASGKTITLGDAYYAAEGTGDTDGGTFQVRFEGSRITED